MRGRGPRASAGGRGSTKAIEGNELARYVVAQECVTNPNTGQPQWQAGGDAFMTAAITPCSIGTDCNAPQHAPQSGTLTLNLLQPIATVRLSYRYAVYQRGALDRSGVTDPRHGGSRLARVFRASIRSGASPHSQPHGAPTLPLTTKNIGVHGQGPRSHGRRRYGGPGPAPAARRWSARLSLH